MIADLPDLIAKRAALSPERVALEDAATGRTPDLCRARRARRPRPPP